MTSPDEATFPITAPPFSLPLVQPVATPFSRATRFRLSHTTTAEYILLKVELPPEELPTKPPGLSPPVTTPRA